MTRKVPFWILLTIVSAIALAFAIRFFPIAFPIVSIDLRMDRAAALQSARDLAVRHGWGPGEPARVAALFSVDDSSKTFIELEGGGADAFREMIATGTYEAYTWQVRLFREGETRETVVRFTPAGRPYGFREKLKEDTPGAALGEAEAEAIAESSAVAWDVVLGPYRRVEASREVRPGGRVDHTFTYERSGVAYGDGHVRMRLVVAGDRLTELTHFLRVPEAFDRRYEKMRSTNNAIALGASGAMGLLYIIGGCMIGLFLLARRRWVVWRPAMIWGASIGGAAALAEVSAWPLAWMNYDTALPASTFLMRNILQWLLLFLADSSLIALSFAAAESLGRRAFPGHPQLWRMWARDAASSKQVLGRTAGGVLLTGIEFGFVIGFYLLALTVWKWWSPAESLINPDLLATWLPWLSAAAPSLRAGFWEEALFRAVPIACGALIGDRFGRRGLGIGIALVIEALVFGGAHANYASEPAYSRPVELFLPALVWGLVYLRFGLLPVVITHFLFDLALFAIPVFTSTAAGNRIDQAMIVLVGLVPLGVVAAARVRAGRWTDLPDSLRNAGWMPSLEQEEVVAEAPEVAPTAAMAPGVARALLALGALGLAAWVIAGGFRADTPPVTVRRPAALRAGVEALQVHGFDAKPRWRTSATIADDDGLPALFVWRALGPRTFRDLLGRELYGPHWQVRAASFHGDIVARAEEWRAHLRPDGSVYRVRHTLPQDSAGASLAEDSARAMALASAGRWFGTSTGALREVSATPAQQKKRTDWTFTFADTSPPRLALGERRVKVEIAGDQFSDARRFVFVPEDWQRRNRAQEESLRVLRIVRTLVLALLIVAAATLAVTGWIRGGFPVAHAARFFTVLVVLGLTASFNQWPVLADAFSTAQPLQLQQTILASALVIGQLLVAAFVALLAGGARRDLRVLAGSAGPPRLLHGIAAGLLAAGWLRATLLVGGGGYPTEGNYGPAATFLPVLAEALAPASSVLIRGSVLLAILLLAHRITRGWTARRLAGGALLAIAGGLAVNPGNAHVPAMWLAQALAAGIGLLLLYAIFLRHDLRLVPWMMATTMVLAAVRTIFFRAHPDAAAGAALGAIVVVVAVWWWTGELGRREAETAPAPATSV